VIALVIQAESLGALRAPGGVLTAGGRLFGFVGTYFLLLMVVLVARVPWLERQVGQERLVRWHRRIAPWALILILAHVLFITLGYAQAAKTGALRQLWTFLASYPDMITAAVGTVLLVVAGAASIRAARRRMKYETWWAVHMYTYLALALSFGHQLATGTPFIGHPLTRAFWTVLWLATAGGVVAFRVLLPVWRNLRHGLTVSEVYEEASGVYSVILSGRRLDRLKVAGGQYFQWRFLTPCLWWHSHPYSLSAMPRPPYLRLTVKVVGDQTAAVSKLRPGTHVLIEGPYGAFTKEARTGNRVALIAAGVGITPVRALLEDLPAGVDVVAIHRASTPDELVLHKEFAQIIERKGGSLHRLVGPREHVPVNAQTLGRLVPDIATRDVYVCGPQSFTKRVVGAARRLGTPHEQIHHELFTF